MAVYVAIDANKISDKFYRYKRQKIRIIQEGKHGGRTKLINLAAIAKNLQVDVADLARFLQKKQGVRLTKSGSTSYFIQSLHVSVDDLEKAIYEFTKQNVLCQTCHLPELKNGECSVCGFVVATSVDVKKQAAKRHKDSTESRFKDEISQQIADTIKLLTPQTKTSRAAQLLVNSCWSIDENAQVHEFVEKWDVVRVQVVEFLGDECPKWLNQVKSE